MWVLTQRSFHRRANAPMVTPIMTTGSKKFFFTWNPHGYESALAAGLLGGRRLNGGRFLRLSYGLNRGAAKDRRAEESQN